MIEARGKLSEERLSNPSISCSPEMGQGGFAEHRAVAPQTELNRDVNAHGAREFLTQTGIQLRVEFGDGVCRPNDLRRGDIRRRL